MTKRYLAITGLKHTGKSTLAPRLARALELSALDLDEEALRLMKRELPPPRDQRTLRAYVEAFGIEEFRRCELAALEELVRDRFDGVLACGGGIVDNAPAIDLLTRSSTIVYLTSKFDTLYERILRGGIPPFLDPEDPRGSFLKLARRRDAAYRSVAEIVVPLEGRTVPQAAEAVFTAIKEHEHAR